MGKVSDGIDFVRRSIAKAIAPDDQMRAAKGTARELDDEMQDHISEIDARIERELNDWGDYYSDGRRYIYGDQLAAVEIKEGWPAVQMNRIFPAIVQEQALLMQRDVTIKADPMEESDTSGAAFWEPILQWQFEVGLDVPSKSVAAIIDGKTHGHWVGKLAWDDRAEWDPQDMKWQGALTMTLPRPEYIIFDPDGKTEDPDKVEWVVEYEPVRKDELLRRYPKAKAAIESAAGGDATIPLGLRQDDEGGEGPVMDKADTGLNQVDRGRLAQLLSPQWLRPTTTGSGDDDPDRGWLRHYFVKDRTTKKTEVVDHEYTGEELVAGGRAQLADDPAMSAEGAEATDALGVPPPQVYLDTATGEPLTEENWPRDKRTVDAPLYPSYRYIVMYGEVVLEDEAWDLKYHPYAMGVNLPLPHTLHGLNGVEMARGLQDVVNELAMHLAAYIAKFADPTVDVEEGAFPADPENTNVRDQLGNGPGRIRKIRAGGVGQNVIRENSPPALQPTVFEIYQLIKSEMEDLLGMHDMGLGRAGSAKTATEAMALETNTKLRTALQWKMIEKWLMRVIRRISELCLRRMEPDQQVRVAGPGQVGVAVLTPQNFDARFDLRLQIATNMPFDRDREKNEALTLFQALGIPLLGKLLDAYGIKDREREDILAKVDAFQQIQAMQELIANKQKEQIGQMQQAGEPNGQAGAAPAGSAAPVPQAAPAGAGSPGA